MSGERRCPSCRALVAVEAEWCGLCYQSLGRPDGPEALLPPGPPTPPVEVPDTAPRTGAGSHPSPGGNGSSGNGYDGNGTPPGIERPYVPPWDTPEARMWKPEGLDLETEASIGPRVERPPHDDPLSWPLAEATGETSGPRGAAWPCPVCQTRNPLELDACAACLAPFSKLFEEEAPEARVDQRTAARWSLVFPGLGHMKLGRAAEGIARAIMFSWALATAIMLVLSRPSTGGPAIVGPLILVFMAASVGLYVLSSVDASRAASGQGPLLTARALLYGTAGLVGLSVLSMLVVVSSAASQFPASGPPPGPIQ